MFTGRGRAGDYWTITVRPDTPEEILPREIMRAGGIAPHGPRHIVAPISLVTWSSANGISHQVTAIEDCRPTLDALTERTCCSFEVGPGGDFATIQAALDALPVNGGRICVRPGVYQEELRIAGRRGVVLSGCAGRTTIQSPGAPASEALLTLDLGDNERDITISNLDFEVSGQVGIRATGGMGVELRRLRLTQNRNPDIQPHSLIETMGTRDVRIMNCRVEMDGGVSQRAAVYIDCPAGALVEGCTIETRTNQPNGLSFAWGGLHIAGGSHDVEIRDNTIRGGRGPGITLGSLAFRALNGARLGPQGAGSGLSDPQPPFSIHGVLQPIVVSDVPYFAEPQPAIEDLVIADNLIERAGGSGISSLALEVPFDDRTNGPPLCYRRRTFPIAHASIEDNRIIDNARQPASGTGDLFAAGGIVLSDARDVTIRGNLITGNGAGMVAPVCGICVSRGQQVSISSNRVLGNGALPDRVTPTEPIPGTSGFGPRYRGGIVLGAPFFGGRTPDRVAREGATNVHVYQNVVEQPDAAALFAVVIGAFRVNNNFLTSFNRGRQITGSHRAGFLAWPRVGRGRSADRRTQSGPVAAACRFAAIPEWSGADSSGGRRGHYEFQWQPSHDCRNQPASTQRVRRDPYFHGPRFCSGESVCRPQPRAVQAPARDDCRRHGRCLGQPCRRKSGSDQCVARCDGSDAIGLRQQSSDALPGCFRLPEHEQPGLFHQRRQPGLVPAARRTLPRINPGVACHARAALWDFVWSHWRCDH